MAAKKGSKDPHPPKVEYGMPLTPSKPLIPWLEGAAKKKKLVRLPLWLSRKDGAFVKTGVHIGNAEDAIVVDVVDTALGVPFVEHAQKKRPSDNLCLLVSDARWKGKVGNAYVLEVVRVYPDVAPRDFAEIEI